jgi:hypothetical protein
MVISSGNRGTSQCLRLEASTGVIACAPRCNVAGSVVARQNFGTAEERASPTELMPSITEESTGMRLDCGDGSPGGGGTGCALARLVGRD